METETGALTLVVASKLLLLGVLLIMGEVLALRVLLPMLRLLLLELLLRLFSLLDSDGRGLGKPAISAESMGQTEEENSGSLSTAVMNRCKKAVSVVDSGVHSHLRVRYSRMRTEILGKMVRALVWSVEMPDSSNWAKRSMEMSS